MNVRNALFVTTIDKNFASVLLCQYSTGTVDHRRVFLVKSATILYTVPMEYDREEARKRAARKRAIAKRKKLRRRRLLVLGAGALLLVLLIVGVVSLIVRAVKKNKQVSALETGAPAAAVTVLASTSAPLPTAVPTPAPTAVPARTPAPAIQADWYRERTEQLYKYLTAYGNYPDAAAVYAALEGMQIDPNGKKLALTFDDGPYAPITEQILDVLEENNARATFFIKGAYIDSGKALDRLNKFIELSNEA